MNKLIKQPLLHFFLAGALIFLAFQFTNQPGPEPDVSAKIIVVDRTALLNFMQFRAQAFQPELFSEQLKAMNEADVSELVADYVREEALYREALEMGMDQGDYIIRQRLVQKVEFLLENMMNQALEPDDATLQSYFDSRNADYLVDAVYTFTHIFFDGDERGWDEAEQDANNLWGSQEIADIAFNDASQYGDRYPFLQNYVERTRDFVINNFTEEFVRQLDVLAPSDQIWYGPLESRYGFHLVMLRMRTEPYVPELAEIRERVLDDWRYDAVLDGRKDAENRVVDAYEVRLNLADEQ